MLLARFVGIPAHRLPWLIRHVCSVSGQNAETATSVLQREDLTMKRMFYLACLAASACFFSACAKSVEKAQRDVEKAHDQAVKNVQQEQKDLRETQRDANERVARQERRVEDAARQGNEKIIQEKRELEDAKRDEARRETNDTTIIDTTPRIND